jgi:hypothetical protein
MALCNNIFGGLVHIPNTATLIPNNLIYFVLSHHNQDIQNIREQRYDNTTNMRGECNGLQALVSNVCLYDYCIHFLIHTSFAIDISGGIKKSYYRPPFFY